MPGSPIHLVQRFFDVLGSKPLTADERLSIDKLLGAEMAIAFFEQGNADQRHGYVAAEHVRRHAPDRQDLQQAAALHDVGKRHARLGIIGRSVASVLILMGMPLSDRMAIYRDHGPRAAAELERLGAPQLVIDFARHHHGERPSSISRDDWSLLQLADQPAKAQKSSDSQISSQER